MKFVWMGWISKEIALNYHVNDIAKLRLGGFVSRTLFDKYERCLVLNGGELLKR
jgi:hypothetical protein